MPGLVLYIDDDPDACALAARMLGSAGYQVVTETNAAAATERAIHEDFDVVLTDLKLGPLDGIEVCQRVLAAKPTLPVVMVTGHATMQAAVDAIRAGAYDFVSKPFEPDILLAALRRATQSTRLRDEVSRLRLTADSASHIGPMIGDSAAMRRVYEAIARVARTDASVLVTGESGTGKELIAKEIHERSARAAGPLVALNCAAVPAALLESELFGHVRGAFTDAKTTRRGLFLEAQGGTLFLDEIGEMPLEMQAKLLRAVQERTVRAVGSSHEVAFDARLITATARDLEAEVAAKTFRLDLYYRINVCAIELPPLRDREGDVAILADRFVARFAERHHKTVLGITSEALAQLIAYRWPGNVRELENCIERAVTMTRTERIVPEDLPTRVRAFRSQAPPPLLPDAIDSLLTLDQREHSYIEHVLRMVGGNKSRAARILGVDRRTLHRKLARAEVGSSIEPTSGSSSSSGVIAAPMDRRLATPPPSVPARDGGATVVLVDGDRDGRQMLKLLLTAEGHLVQGVRSVAAALALDVEVSVYVVAGSAGDGNASELIIPGGPPVVLITSEPQAHANDGHDAVLRKPAAGDDVARTVRRLLDQRAN